VGTATFFANQNQILCSDVQVLSAVASCTTHDLTTIANDPLDVINLSAGYSGDANYEPSTSAPLVIVMLRADEAIYLSGFEANVLGCPPD
jgi:hypothetical protein